jgi:hypothetical protein
MLHPAAPTDLLAQLRAHVSQALALLDGVAIAVHPAASLTARRWTNRTAVSGVGPARVQRLTASSGP